VWSRSAAANWKCRYVRTNTLPFVVATGDRANFHLLGGVHSFNNGLSIRNAATLTGFAARSMAT